MPSDRERLDWLQRSDNVENLSYDARGAALLLPGEFCEARGYIETNEDGWPVFNSVRAAIDAAMQSTQPNEAHQPPSDSPSHLGERLDALAARDWKRVNDPRSQPPIPAPDSAAHDEP